MKGFLEFLREQGVVGLAIGFIMGGAVSKVVASLVADLINPLLGIVLGAAGDLSEMSLKVGGAQLLWGHFIAIVIDFVVVAGVVYYGTKLIGIDKLDKKK